MGAPYMSLDYVGMMNQVRAELEKFRASEIDIDQCEDAILDIIARFRKKQIKGDCGMRFFRNYAIPGDVNRYL